MDGLKLNMWVAEHVMGYVFVNGDDGTGPYSILMSQECAKNWVEQFPKCSIAAQPHVDRSDVLPQNVPAFSTNMNDAWKVMESMRSRLFSVRNRFKESLSQEINNRLKTTVELSEIPLLMEPIDICGAALAALAALAAIASKTPA